MCIDSKYNKRSFLNLWRSFSFDPTQLLSQQVIENVLKCSRKVWNSSEKWGASEVQEYNKALCRCRRVGPNTGISIDLIGFARFDHVSHSLLIILEAGSGFIMDSPQICPSMEPTRELT